MTESASYAQARVDRKPRTINHMHPADGGAFILPSAATEAILCRTYATARS